MDDALETDLPVKKIPPDLVVPKGRREEHSGDGKFFYFHEKARFDGKCFICENDFDDINLAWFKDPVWFGEKSGHVICGGSCWAEYTGISEHCGACKAWAKHVERLKSCTRRGEAPQETKTHTSSAGAELGRQ